MNMVAWTPWKNIEGVHCVDSCGIWVIEAPCSVVLHYPLSMCHDNDGGVFWHGVDANYMVYEHGNKPGLPQKGPGQRLDSYFAQGTPQQRSQLRREDVLEMLRPQWTGAELKSIGQARQDKWHDDEITRLQNDGMAADSAVQH